VWCSRIGRRCRPRESIFFVGYFCDSRISMPLARSAFACQSCRMLDEGVWAEVKVGGEHLRLFSEHNALGVQASVYNVNTKNWIAPSESVEDIRHGKEKASAHAEAYLKRTGNLDLPTLEWKKSRSA
jgi:hypothetical protein